MQVKIIQIGNSKGLILSNMILDKYGIKDQVEIVLEKDHFIIKTNDNPIEGWESQFAKMAALEDDKLLIPDVFTDEIL